MELRASAPLVTFKESVATDVAPSTGAGEDAGTPDRPPQLTLPPWSEEEGAATAAGGVCVLETPSKDCRLTVRCLPLPDSLARMLEAEPTEARDQRRHRRACMLASTLKLLRAVRGRCGS